MNRRNFLAHTSLGTAAVISGCFGTVAEFEEGCSFSSVMSQLAKYLPIGLQALAGVATLINPAAGSAVAGIIGLVNTAWGALQGAVNDYNSAPAASKQTTLEKVLVALDSVQEYLASVTKSLGVSSDTVVKAATAALLLISTTLASIEAQLAPQAAPAVTAAHVSHAAAIKAATTSVTVTSGIVVTGKPSDFKSCYNTIMQQAGRADLKL